MKKNIFLLFCLLFPITSYCFDQAKVAGEDINVRADSTVMSNSLILLNDGETIEIVSENFDWYKVRLPKRYGCYLSEEFVKDKGSGKGEVTAPILNLRSEPSMKSRVIGKIKQGESVTILEKENGWYKVSGYPYATGWVHKKFLKKLAQTAQDKTNILLKEGIILPFYRADCQANYVLLNNKKRTLVRINYDKGRKFINKKVKIKGKNIINDGCEYVFVEKLSFPK